MHLLLFVAIPVAGSSTPYCTTGTLGHVQAAETSPSSSRVVASVCCPASCAQCGGVDCWSQPSGLACCAAHVFALGAPTCTLPSDTGCILPTPSVTMLPDALREPSCLDTWSAAFPGEREDWKGRSCGYKVHWGQCSTFYASCQCSCGYCHPSKASCDPNARLLPPPPPMKLQHGKDTRAPHPPTPSLLAAAPPPPPPAPLLFAPPNWELLFSTPSSSAVDLKEPDKPLRSPSRSVHSTMALLAALLGLLSCLILTLRSLCYCASKPDAPLWLQACSYACCGSAFLHQAGGSAPTGTYAPVMPSPSVVLGSMVDGNSGARRAAVASALLDEEDEDDTEEVPDLKGDGTASGSGKHRGKTRTAGLAAVDEDGLDFDAEAIYGDSMPLDHDEPDDHDDPEDDIAPDDSISVVFSKPSHHAATLPQLGSQTAPRQPMVTPVTIETPDGTRHAMDVELQGVRSARELRRGMLQGYNELVGTRVASRMLHVHARLASGSSVLIKDDSPLNAEVLRAVSFYVWARKG